MRVQYTPTKPRELGHGVVEDLRVGDTYTVIALNADRMQGARLMIRSPRHGRPYWYPAADFTVTDPSVPRQWQAQIEGGLLTLAPPALLRPGFYDEYWSDSPDSRVVAALEEAAKGIEETS